MTSRLNRVLDVLEAFADGTSVLSAEQICTRAGTPIATGYRHIRELCDAGLMVRLPHGYAPGPRIIEWDYMVRSHDPMLLAARELVDELAADTGLELLLSQLYGERIVNVHYAHHAGNAVLDFGRGRVLPLFRGSSSRVILAALPTRKLRALFEAHRDHPDLAAWEGDWKRFAKAHAEVRKRGYAISRGEMHTDRVGLAAPIFVGSGPEAGGGSAGGHVLGSLTVIGTTARVEAFREDYLSRRVVETAAAISRRIALEEPARQARPTNGTRGDHEHRPS